MIEQITYDRIPKQSPTVPTQHISGPTLHTENVLHMKQLVKMLQGAIQPKTGLARNPDDKQKPSLHVPASVMASYVIEPEEELVIKGSLSPTAEHIAYVFAIEEGVYRYLASLKPATNFDMTDEFRTSALLLTVVSNTVATDNLATAGLINANVGRIPNGVTFDTLPSCNSNNKAKVVGANLRDGVAILRRPHSTDWLPTNAATIPTQAIRDYVCTDMLQDLHVVWTELTADVEIDTFGSQVIYLYRPNMGADVDWGAALNSFTFALHDDLGNVLSTTKLLRGPGMFMGYLILNEPGRHAARLHITASSVQARDGLFTPDLVVAMAPTDPTLYPSNPDDQFTVWIRGTVQESAIVVSGAATFDVVPKARYYSQVPVEPAGAVSPIYFDLANILFGSPNSTFATAMRLPSYQLLIAQSMMSDFGDKVYTALGEAAHVYGQASILSAISNIWKKGVKFLKEHGVNPGRALRRVANRALDVAIENGYASEPVVVGTASMYGEDLDDFEEMSPEDYDQLMAILGSATPSQTSCYTSTGSVRYADIEYEHAEPEEVQAQFDLTNIFDMAAATPDPSLGTASSVYQDPVLASDSDLPAEGQEEGVGEYSDDPEDMDPDEFGQVMDITAPGHRPPPPPPEPEKPPEPDPEVVVLPMNSTTFSTYGAVMKVGAGSGLSFPRMAGFAAVYRTPVQYEGRSVLRVATVPAFTHIDYKPFDNVEYVPASKFIEEIFAADGRKVELNNDFKKLFFSSNYRAVYKVKKATAEDTFRYVMSTMLHIMSFIKMPQYAQIGQRFSQKESALYITFINAYNGQLLAPFTGVSWAGSFDAAIASSTPFCFAEFIWICPFAKALWARPAYLASYNLYTATACVSTMVGDLPDKIAAIVDYCNSPESPFAAILERFTITIPLFIRATTKGFLGRIKKWAVAANSPRLYHKAGRKEGQQLRDVAITSLTEPLRPAERHIHVFFGFDDLTFGIVTHPAIGAAAFIANAGVKATVETTMVEAHNGLGQTVLKGTSKVVMSLSKQLMLVALALIAGATGRQVTTMVSTSGNPLTELKIGDRAVTPLDYVKSLLTGATVTRAYPALAEALAIKAEASSQQVLDTLIVHIEKFPQFFQGFSGPAKIRPGNVRNKYMTLEGEKIMSQKAFADYMRVYYPAYVYMWLAATLFPYGITATNEITGFDLKHALPNVSIPEKLPVIYPSLLQHLTTMQAGQKERVKEVGISFKGEQVTADRVQPVRQATYGASAKRLVPISHTIDAYQDFITQDNINSVDYVYASN